MSMNIMPILSRRGSAGIRHNIAQFCQAGCGNILEEVRMRSVTPGPSSRQSWYWLGAGYFALSLL
jgi:hypothetical protein